MAAHNLPALVQLGPRLPAVLAAFLAGQHVASGTAPDAAVAVTPSSPLWAVEVAIVLIGFPWSAALARRDLPRPGAGGFDRAAVAYPAWVFFTIAMTALVILFQPLSALAGR